MTRPKLLTISTSPTFSSLHLSPPSSFTFIRKVWTSPGIISRLGPQGLSCDSQGSVQYIHEPRLLYLLVGIMYGLLFTVDCEPESLNGTPSPPRKSRESLLRCVASKCRV